MVTQSFALPLLLDLSLQNETAAEADARLYAVAAKLPNARRFGIGWVSATLFPKHLHWQAGCLPATPGDKT